MEHPGKVMAGMPHIAVSASRDDSPTGFADRSLSSHSSHFRYLQRGSCTDVYDCFGLRRRLRTTKTQTKRQVFFKRRKDVRHWNVVCVCVLRCHSSDLTGRLVVHWTSHRWWVPLSGLGADGGHASRSSLLRMCCNDATVHCADVTRPCHQAALCSRPEVVTLVAVGMTSRYTKRCCGRVNQRGRSFKGHWLEGAAISAVAPKTQYSPGR